MQLTVGFSGGSGSCPGRVGEGEGRDQGSPGAAAVWQGELHWTRDFLSLGARHQLVVVGASECG